MKVDVPFIFFSGLDRTGKSTARKLFSTETNQEFITFDRSPIDNCVYNEMFRKDVFSPEDLELYVKRIANLGNVYIIYLTLDYKEINRRTYETEGLTYPIQELIDCDNLFNKYLTFCKTYGIKTININCNGKIPIQIVEEIKERIK